MGIQRVRQWQRLEQIDDLKSWSEKHLKDHGAESSLRIQDFDHNRLTNLHPSMLVTDSPTFVGLTLSGLTASKPVFTSAAKALVSTGTLGLDQGGTGLTSLGAANTVLGVNTSGTALTYKNFYAYNVKDYGATGDGVTDDSVSIKAAITASAGAIVYFPGGTYFVGANPNIEINGKTLIGSSKSGTIITATNGCVFSKVAAETYVKNLTIKHTTPGQVGSLVKITDAGTAGFSFINCDFLRGERHIDGQWNNQEVVSAYFENCIFSGATICSRDFYSLWAYTEIHCYTWYNFLGMKWRVGSTNTFYNSVFEYNTQSIHIQTSGDLTGVGFFGCHFEDAGATPATPVIHVETTGAHSVKNISFYSCWLKSLKNNFIYFTPGGGGNINYVAVENCVARMPAGNDFADGVGTLASKAFAKNSSLTLGNWGDIVNVQNLSSSIAEFHAVVSTTTATSALFSTSDWVPTTTGSGLLIKVGAASGNTHSILQAYITGATSVGNISLNPSGGNVGIGTATPTSKLHVVSLSIYANNAAAVAGGLTAGAFYRTGADPDPVMVVH